jgi:hypothetical protein
VRGRGAKERDRIEALERRALWLTKAIEDPEGWKGRSPDRARMERKSIRWALRILDCSPTMTLREARDYVWAEEQRERCAEDADPPGVRRDVSGAESDNPVKAQPAP